jgi:hypothetical protein
MNTFLLFVVVTENIWPQSATTFYVLNILEMVNVKINL